MESKIKTILNKRYLEIANLTEQIDAINYAFDWFIDLYPNVNFSHQDVRGLYSSIILATDDDVKHIFEEENIARLKKLWETSEHYQLFKKQLVTIGTATISSRVTTYFYIGTNKDVLSHEDWNIMKVINTLKARANTELFKHISNYFRNK